MYVCMCMYMVLWLCQSWQSRRGMVMMAWLVVSAVWVMVGLGMKGGVIGGVWEVWGGLCGRECALCIG